jgi:hypothetical protein
VIANGQQVVIDILEDRIGDEPIWGSGITQASTVVQILILISIINDMYAVTRS